MPKRHPKLTTNARKLRASQTEAESLLWQVVRDRRLCGLKFRRQFPIEPFIVDFACVDHRLIVELDGPYHDDVYEDDQSRQQRLEADGWQIIRFHNEEVLENVEVVAFAIGRKLGLEAKWDY